MSEDRTQTITAIDTDSWGSGGDETQVVGAAITEAREAFSKGEVVAGRYEIQTVLGEGGMGAVYRATDREVDREVALKVIHPKLAEHPDIIRRFKQELVLARAVTHRNVVRIYDLGVAGGLKFISMEYIEGRELGDIVKDRGKLPPKEAAALIHQVCQGLAVAHKEGVVHRDLKPSNIMVDQQGRAAVMDFGIAHSLNFSAAAETADGRAELEAGGHTQVGALIGTPRYMSPEQARGKSVDARSDLYSLGLILCEALTGRLPFETVNTLEKLLERTRVPARRVRELDASIPRALDEIVAKCLQIEPAKRYQSAAELQADLEIYLGVGEAAMQRRSKIWKIAAPSVALVVTLAVVFTYQYLTRPREQKVVRLLIADFENRTADRLLDGTMETAMQGALEGAGFINVYGRPQARRIARQLAPKQQTLNENLARLVATREGIETVLTGAVTREGGRYSLTVKAVDARTAKPLGDWTASADNRNGLLQAVGAVAAPLRKSLGDVNAEAEKLANAETYSSASLEAAHSYSVAQELRYAGKSDEAIQAYQRAIELDPNFGTAYASLAAMYSNLGNRDEAKNYYRQAMARSDRMTDREKYRTRGGFYLASIDAPKAIEELTSLVREYPADSMGHSALAYAHYLGGNLPKAIEEGKKALEIFPNNVPYRNNVALYSLYAGDFEAASSEARSAMKQNPRYLKGYPTAAAAEIMLGRFDQAERLYGQLEGLSPAGASLAMACRADMALFRGQFGAAIDILKKGIAADVAAKNGAAEVTKRVILAEALLGKGQQAAALAEISKVLAAKRESLSFAAALLLLSAGKEAEAAKIADEMGQRFEPVQEAFSKLIFGEIQYRKGRLRDALTLFTESVKASDTWLGRFALGRLYLSAKDYARADTELDKAMKRRGEAVDVFIDEVQSLRFYPPLLLKVAESRGGLGSASAAEPYKQYLALKAADSDDPLVQQLRARYR